MLLNSRRFFSMWLFRGCGHLLSYCRCHLLKPECSAPRGRLRQRRHTAPNNAGLEVPCFISVPIRCGLCSSWLGGCLSVTALYFGRGSTTSHLCYTRPLTKALYACDSILYPGKYAGHCPILKILHLLHRHCDIVT